jgi:two-component system, sensor histidine kinase and response regulator
MSYFLPRSQNYPLVMESHSADLPEVNHLSNTNILIVDDTPSNLRLLSSMLTQQGYEVRSAISGSVALMAVQSIQPDLILLDINMPGMNGYEVCSQLKADAATQEIPVVFLSALGEAIDKVRGFQAGGVDYITKPFQVEEVLARVENQLTLRRARVELQQAKADAICALEREKELNRLKSEFVSMVSHDFRTPLTSIQGFAELLHTSRDRLTPEVQTRYFNKIEGAVEQMLHLLDEVLLIGSVEFGKLPCQPQPIDLEKFCQDVIETIQLDVSGDHRLQFTLTGDCSKADLDPTLLRQILTNLLSNAIKYSPDQQPIQLIVSRQADQFKFEVRDRGMGIPSDSMQHLFDAFYRSKNVGQIRGTGLGLAVVKRCVEAHQGTIEIVSEEGLGTTVTIYL